ncbi:MAG: OadG family transporter subunit [Chromatiales bacterium]|jgi:oxaloacetate decarboxylase gamma subunit
MGNNEMMLEGLKLLGLGMGSVFLFLVVLVFAMKTMSALANIFDAGESPAIPGTPPTATGQGNAVDTVVPVIAAAIAAYRHNHK